MVVDAINRTDMDLRKSLFGNIVLSGGSTLTKGFGDRLLHEVQKLAVKDMRIKIWAPPERKYSTWIGGSILAGLSTFRKVSEVFRFMCGSVVGVVVVVVVADEVWRHRCGLVSATGRRIRVSSIRNSLDTQSSKLLPLNGPATRTTYLTTGSLPALGEQPTTL